MKEDRREEMCIYLYRILATYNGYYRRKEERTLSRSELYKSAPKSHIKINVCVLRLCTLLKTHIFKMNILILVDFQRRNLHVTSWVYKTSPQNMSQGKDYELYHRSLFELVHSDLNSIFELYHEGHHAIEH